MGRVGSCVNVDTNGDDGDDDNLSVGDGVNVNSDGGNNINGNDSDNNNDNSDNNVNGGSSVGINIDTTTNPTHHQPLLLTLSSLLSFSLLLSPTHK